MAWRAARTLPVVRSSQRRGGHRAGGGSRPRRARARRRRRSGAAARGRSPSASCSPEPVPPAPALVAGGRHGRDASTRPGSPTARTPSRPSSASAASATGLRGSICGAFSSSASGRFSPRDPRRPGRSAGARRLRRDSPGGPRRTATTSATAMRVLHTLAVELGLGFERDGRPIGLGTRSMVHTGARVEFPLTPGQRASELRLRLARAAGVRALHARGRGRRSRATGPPRSATRPSSTPPWPWFSNSPLGAIRLGVHFDVQPSRRSADAVSDGRSNGSSPALAARAGGRLRVDRRGAPGGRGAGPDGDGGRRPAALDRLGGRRRAAADPAPRQRQPDRRHRRARRDRRGAASPARTTPRSPPRSEALGEDPDARR